MTEWILGLTVINTLLILLDRYEKPELVKMYDQQNEWLRKKLSNVEDMYDLEIKPDLDDIQNAVLRHHFYYGYPERDED